MKDPKEKNITVSLGGRIRLLRDRMGMDQEEFGEFLDCSKDSVSKIERGEQKMKFWRLIRLCDVCEVSMDFLLRGIDVSDIDDVPFYVVEMYKKADSWELSILNEHMQNAKNEIRRKQELIKQYNNMLNVSRQFSE